MTRDDIIRMAREIFDVETDNRGRETFSGDNYGVERFASLVAAAERGKYEAKFKQLEAIMQEREQQPNKPCCLAEREACAKVCDEFESEADPDAGFVLAAAIRARSNT